MMRFQSSTITRALGVILAAWGLSSCSDRDAPAIAQDMPQLAATDDSSVSVTEAGSVALAFGSERFGITPSRSNTSSMEPVTDRNGQTVAFAVNYDSGGWVLVGSDKNYYPVLAYSHEQSGQFSTSDLNDGVKLWIEEVSHAIESSESLDSATTALIAFEWQKYLPETMSSYGPGVPGDSPQAVAFRTRLKYLNDTYYQDGWVFTSLASANKSIVPSHLYGSADAYNSPYELTIFGYRNHTTIREIGPLTTTEWDQTNGYNALCPNGIKAGCVPVAIAQIMKFHEYPARFDRKNMSDTKATYATQFLISEIRNALGMGIEEGSNYIEAEKALRSFGYSTTIKSHPADVIVELLVNKRPIYMRGEDPAQDAAHAWVCDGVKEETTEFQYYSEYINSDNTYDTSGEDFLKYPVGDKVTSLHVVYHMNWGWGGRNNDWYIDAKVKNDDYTTNIKYIYISK